MLHISYPQFQSSKFYILALNPGNGLDSHLASFIHWVGRAMGRVTNSLAITHKAGWRDAPLAIRNFRRSNKHNENILFWQKTDGII